MTPWKMCPFSKKFQTKKPMLMTSSCTNALQGIKNNLCLKKKVKYLRAALRAKQLAPLLRTTTRTTTGKFLMKLPLLNRQRLKKSSKEKIELSDSPNTSFWIKIKRSWRQKNFMNRFYKKRCRIKKKRFRIKAFNRSLKAMERNLYTILIQKAAQNR